MALNKEQILKAAGTVTVESVSIPKWGGDVFIKVMSGVERDSWESEQFALKNAGKDNLANFRARFVARCLCDENGNRLFTDKEAAELGKAEAPELNKLFAACMKLNALSPEEVGELEKN